MEEYEVNYFELKTYCFWRKMYLVIDTWRCYSEFIFDREMIPANDVDFFETSGPYIMIAYTIPKRAESRFLDALKSMENLIVLCGHTDYPKDCKFIIGKFREYALQPSAREVKWYHRLFSLLGLW